MAQRLRMTDARRLQAVRQSTDRTDDFSDLDTDFLTPIIPGSLDVDCRCWYNTTRYSGRGLFQQLEEFLRAQQRAGVQAHSFMQEEWIILLWLQVVV